jgi:deoxycytidylate deaminase
MTMHSVIDHLIEKHPKGSNKSKSYHHIACTIKHDCICTIGTNDSDETYPGCCYSVHAEMAAILKLPPKKSRRGRRRKTKKLEKFDLVVIRINRYNQLLNSKPCIQCLTFIRFKMNTMAFKMENIYYSNENGQISCQKFLDLLRESNEDRHKSRRFRHKEFKNTE